MSDEYKGWIKHQRLINEIVESMSPNAQKEFYKKQHEVLVEILDEEERRQEWEALPNETKAEISRQVLRMEH